MGLEKIKPLEELSLISEQERRKGKIIVTTNGCFDLFHAGHLDLLESAKKQGDILIVGMNSDRSVKSYKGDKRPIIPEEQRARILSALECVNYITIYDDVSSLNFVKSIKPHIHVNDVSYGENCIEAEIVKKYGGRIYLVGHKTKISTTGIIDRIKEL